MILMLPRFLCREWREFSSLDNASSWNRRYASILALASSRGKNQWAFRHSARKRPVDYRSNRPDRLKSSVTPCVGPTIEGIRDKLPNSGPLSTLIRCLPRHAPGPGCGADMSSRALDAQNRAFFAMQATNSLVVHDRPKSRVDLDAPHRALCGIAGGRSAER